MPLVDALELVLRYAVAAGCEWLASHGWMAAKEGDFVTAATAIASAVVVAALTLARAFYKSTASYVLRRLQAHHPVALVAAASEVSASGHDAPPAGGA